MHGHINEEKEKHTDQHKKTEEKGRNTEEDNLWEKTKKRVTEIIFKKR